MDCRETPSRNREFPTFSAGSKTLLDFARRRPSAVRANRIRKSIGAENTFSVDLTTFDAMAVELRPLIDKVWRHCDSTGNRGRTVTLKVKFFDFEIITRSRSVATVVSSRGCLESLAIALLQAEMPFLKSVRLLGVSLSSLHTLGDDDVEPQLDLPV
ncbi:nucleotidyltransferase/DNA polymerase involved in DNA repair [Bradyrhizobium sp. JR7.2]|nr:DNA polymerase IV EC 2777 CDS [Bradyrhizobium sp.]